jgi:leader peptidase (prepilin peptidase)/N-methyltransferase
VSAGEIVLALAALATLPLLAALADWLPRQMLADDARAVAATLGRPPPPAPLWRDSLATLRHWPALLLMLAMALALLLLAPRAADPRQWALAGSVLALLVLARIDFEHRLLPDALTLGLLWAGLLMQTVPALRTAGVEAALWGCLVGYLPFRALDLTYARWRGHDGMGQGDMKLLAALGAWWGPWMPIATFLVGSVIALVPWLALWLLRRTDLRQAFPFGPALVAAALGLLWVGGGQSPA